MYKLLKERAEECVRAIEYHEASARESVIAYHAMAWGYDPNSSFRNFVNELLARNEDAAR